MKFGIPTNKQIAILKVIHTKGMILARWDSQDMRDLLQCRFVESHSNYGANGKLHSAYTWTLSDMGEQFLAVERAGV